MPAYAAAIAGGLDFAGGIMSRNAGISLGTLRRRGRQSIAQARSSEGLFAGLQKSQLLSAHKKQLAGYAGAQKALELGGQAARQGVEQRGRGAQASLEQSLVSKGLIGTSAGAGMFAGLQDQTSRQLADIDLQLAQALGQLGLEKADVEGQQGRELAGLAAQDRDFNRQMEEFYAQLMTSGSITK